MKVIFLKEAEKDGGSSFQMKQLVEKGRMFFIDYLEASTENVRSILTKDKELCLFMNSLTVQDLINRDFTDTSESNNRN